MLMNDSRCDAGCCTIYSSRVHARTRSELTGLGCVREHCGARGVCEARVSHLREQKNVQAMVSERECAARGVNRRACKTPIGMRRCVARRAAAVSPVRPVRVSRESYPRHGRNLIPSATLMHHARSTLSIMHGDDYNDTS